MFGFSFQATLESNKLDLAWTLLRKQRKDASLQKLDKKDRNLLHLLAIHSAKLWTQVVEEVCRQNCTRRLNFQEHLYYCT